MSLSVSRHLSRARALSLLEEKKNNRTKLLDEGRNEGLYIEHRLAKATSVHKDVELSKAFIFSKIFFRNDRKTQEKQYYVIGATCKIHADNDSIVLSRLDRFHRNASPCLLCMSSNDVLGIASIQSNIKRDTLYAQTRRGLPASEVVKLALRKKALLENKNPRAPAIRDKSHYMKDLSVYEKFQAKLGSYTQGDPRREKLKKLLDNFDFSGAVVSKEESITFLTGIRCSRHPGLDIEKKQLGRLLEGANPCPKCKEELRSKVSRGKPRLRWTTDRLIREVERNTVLQNSLSRFDLSCIKVGTLLKGGRNCAHVFEIRCKNHDMKVAPILMAHFLNGKIFCSECPRTNTYTNTEAKRMLFQAHGSTISLVKYGGKISVASKYTCNFCDETWDAALSNVIGHMSKKTYRMPTGCPKCYSMLNISENNVSVILESFGFNMCSSVGAYINIVIPSLRNISKSYARLVGVKRNNQRELRVDYIINTGERLFAIEVDGPQHYGLRYLNYGHEDFQSVAQLDSEKMQILSNDYNIEVCRLPLPLLSKDENFRSEIEKITKNCPTWTGLPDKNWISRIL